jgi:pyrroline-5-carboxylate reductase
MNIGIIGGGVMGELILSSLLDKHILNSDELWISDQSEERRNQLRDAYSIHTTEDNIALISACEVVLFCVKPQNAAQMMQQLCGRFRTGQVIVSIMAGVSIATIHRLTGHSTIVRSMPNIPARIGEGMTVWLASPDVDDTSRMIVKMIFQAFGLESRVENEDMVDAATAISGSGPAYIFYVAENLMKAAEGLGFSREQAHRLTQQTFRGAMDLWHKTGDDPGKLRLSVTSKGGTTAAALKEFERRDTPAIFQAAIRAAYVRAGQLREVADGKPDLAEQ